MAANILLFVVLTFIFVSNGVIKSVKAGLDVTRRLTVTKGEQMIKLQCPHRGAPRILRTDFESVLWLLHDEHIMIGAEVEYDHHKYIYLASTGELAIQNIVYEDSGIYRCIVRFRNNTNNFIPQQTTSAVQLFVQQPYKNLWEEEYKWNFIRGLISAGIAATLITSCCIIYKFRWRDEPNYNRYKTTELEIENGLDNLGLELEPHQQQYCEKLEEDGFKVELSTTSENTPGNSIESSALGPDNPSPCEFSSSICFYELNTMSKLISNNTRI